MRKTISVSVLVTVMVVLACGVALAAGSRVNISTLRCDAPNNDHETLNSEYVVFKNTSGRVVRMEGFKVFDKGRIHTYRFPNNFRLRSRDSVTLYTGSGRNTSSRLYWGQGSAVWNNTGDTATLINRNGRVLDRQSCTDR
jgi:micrococcal nuclease